MKVFKAVVYLNFTLFSKILNSEDVTLEEILNDEDFLSELRISNENLLSYLDYSKVNEMIDILLNINSSECSEMGVKSFENWSWSLNKPEKSFRIPFIIWESFCMEINHFTDIILDPENKYELFTRFLKYFIIKTEDGKLSQTLTWYVSKIITFMWLKRPEAVLDWIGSQLNILGEMAEHIYLTEWISDLLVKFVTLSVYDTDQNLKVLEAVQAEIMSILVKILEDKESSEDKIEQALETINSIARKWYLVTNKSFFFENWFNQDYIEIIMGESLFERLIKFVFSSEIPRSKALLWKWIDVIDIITNNLFIKTPIESAQDVTEYQFGFVVSSIGGKTIEEINEGNENAKMSDADSEESKQNTKEVDENESKVLEQQNNKKKSVLEHQTNIFPKEQGSTKVVDLFLKYFKKFWSFLEAATADTQEYKALSSHRRSISLGAGVVKSMIPSKYRNEPVERLFIAKLLNIFNILLTLDSAEFQRWVKESSVLKHIVELWEIYDDHSLIQSNIRKIFISILRTQDIVIKKLLLNEARCIFLFAKKLNMVDFSHLLSGKKWRGNFLALKFSKSEGDLHYNKTLSSGHSREHGCKDGESAWGHAS